MHQMADGGGAGRGDSIVVLARRSEDGADVGMSKTRSQAKAVFRESGSS